MNPSNAQIWGSYVWLATSSSQVRLLWQKVGELLGDELTRLQREALMIPPTPDAPTA